jgi:predicted Zn-dependent protease
MKTGTQQFFGKATDLMAKYANTTINGDLLIEQAKNIFRDALAKNDGFQFTEEDERKLLQSFENENLDHFYIKSKPLQKTINHITARIQQTIQDLYEKTVPLNIIVIDNPSMNDNAWALPNGTVLIGISVLTQLENVEELYFIIAHEAGHVLKQHAAVHSNVQWMANKIQTGFFSKLRRKNPIVHYIAETSASIALNILKRQQLYKRLLHHDECESDKIATNMMYHLNMSPVTGCNILIRLSPEDQESNSHPRSSDRVLKIKQLPKSDHPVKTISEPMETPEDFMQLKKLAEREVVKTKQKRRFITFVSVAAGAASLVPLIPIVYYLAIMPVFENFLLRVVQETVAHIVVRVAAITGIALFGFGSCKIYEKTYQKLKGTY